MKKDNDDGVVQHGDQCPVNRLTETCSLCLQCISLILDMCVSWLVSHDHFAALQFRLISKLFSLLEVPKIPISIILFWIMVSQKANIPQWQGFLSRATYIRKEITTKKLCHESKNNVELCCSAAGGVQCILLHGTYHFYNLEYLWLTCFCFWYWSDKLSSFIPTSTLIIIIIAIWGAPPLV